MKTATIDLMKKELLIVEIPEETYYEVFKHGILFKDHLESEREFIEGSFTLLGSPDEIKEEDVKDLVQYLTRRDLTITPKNYSKGKDGRFEDITFTESILSALEKEILWENPYGKEPIENLQSSTFGGEKIIIHRNPMNILWHEAESRTFDKKRVKMFVKN